MKGIPPPFFRAGRLRVFLGVLSLVVFASPVRAQPKLPALFSDHMVLQRDMAAPIWGWASAGEVVKISGGGVEATATADGFGNWKTKLGPLKATTTPFELTVSAASGSVMIKDVLVGDVWICSGQSNMQWSRWLLDHSEGGGKGSGQSLDPVVCGEDKSQPRTFEHGGKGCLAGGNPDCH